MIIDNLYLYFRFTSKKYTKYKINTIKTSLSEKFKQINSPDAKCHVLTELPPHKKTRFSTA